MEAIKGGAAELPEFKIPHTINPDGTVTLQADEFHHLVEERNELLGDILLSSGHIGKLLITLGVMDKHGEFQEPSWGKISGTITKLMFGKNAGPFEHIKELGPVLQKYAHTIKH
jgi:hypothetical protein